MKALVIYDLTGHVWNIVYGAVETPQGLTCMWVDIPEGAQLERIDVTDPEHPQPIFNYLPQSDIGILQAKVSELEKVLNPTIDIETCTLTELQNYTQKANKAKLAAYLEAHPLLWTDGERYGCTQEDQIEMSTDLQAYTIMQTVDNTWKLEWHNVKKACREFALEEFNALLVAIITYVYPLRRKQETFKQAIYEAETKEEVLAINIDYENETDDLNDTGIEGTVDISADAEI